MYKYETKKILSSDYTYNGINLLKVSYGAFQHYRHNVRDNYYMDSLTARKKLTRNVLLAIDSRQCEGNDEIYTYGKLRIVVRNYTIIFIENMVDKDIYYRVDRNRYEELNEILGIRNEKKRYRRNDYNVENKINESSLMG